MSLIVYKVEFLRYDEDIISVISSSTRYFVSPEKANKEAADWMNKSSRHEVATTVIEVE